MHHPSSSRPLAILGGVPAFSEPLHVGRPNIGDRTRLRARFEQMLDQRWLTNSGPLVVEFEQIVASRLGVAHCVATCNGTSALMLAAAALGMKGEVIVPSFTFIATAHALQWQGITPVFADLDPRTHNLDPADVARRITPRTTGILGVHLWGRPCAIEELQAIARQHQLKLLFDASHAFACTHAGVPIGRFGDAEVFSFHATKFVNAFEGGAITTNNGALAEQLRLTRNFGFIGYDTVESLGLNAKMPEVCAAMGLTSLESIDHFIALNRAHHLQYEEELAGLPGLRLREYDPHEQHNFQYPVLEIDPVAASLDREELLQVLHAEGILARRYFHPGCHRLEPYRSLNPDLSLPQTEALCARVLTLPAGEVLGRAEVSLITEVIRAAFQQAPSIRARF